MENLETQKSTARPEMQPAKQQEAKEQKKEMSPEARALYLEMFGDLKQAMKDKKPGEAVELPDFSAKIDAADGSTLSEIRSRLEDYQAKLIDWKQKSAAVRIDAEKNPGMKAKLENSIKEAEANTEITKKLSEMLDQGEKTRAMRAAGYTPEVKAKSEPAVEKEADWGQMVGEGLQAKQNEEMLNADWGQMVDEALGEQAPTVRTEKAADYDMSLSPFKGRKDSEVFASKWPTQTESEVEKKIMSEDEVEAERAKLRARVSRDGVPALRSGMSAKSDSELARERILEQVGFEAPAASLEAGAESQTAGTVSLRKPKAEKAPVDMSAGAISPAKEMETPQNMEVAIMFENEAAQELPPAEEAKASNVQLVMERFKELPSWLKKGLSKLKNLGALPPQRDIVGGSNVKLEKGGPGMRFLRATALDEAEPANMESEPELDSQQIAELSVKLEDTLAAKYPNKVRDIMRAGIKETAPEVSYQDIEKQINDESVPFDRKLKLLQELNYRYNQDREYGSTAPRLSNPEWRTQQNAAAEKAAQKARMAASVAKIQPNQKEAA